MNVVPIPCLRDNYAYLVFQTGEPDCFVIDPSEAEPVKREVARRGLRLRAIVCTHHHHDHVGGNLELKAPGIEVFGHSSDQERIPGFSRSLDHGDRVVLAGLEFQALHVPGHTLGALCYVGEGAAFTGDTLFCGGCGRLFEGSAEQMFDSLHRVIGALPDDITIYTGHEYTQANLRFATRLEPQNETLRARLRDVTERRKNGDFCASAGLSLERRTNPFLRPDSPEIRTNLNLQGASAVEVFARIRALKDAA